VHRVIELDSDHRIEADTYVASYTKLTVDGTASDVSIVAGHILIVTPHRSRPEPRATFVDSAYVYVQYVYNVTGYCGSAKCRGKNRRTPTGA